MICIMDGFDWKPDDSVASASTMIRHPWTQLTATAIAASRSRFSPNGSAAVLFSFNSMDYYLTPTQRDATIVIGFAMQQLASQIANFGVDFYTDAGANKQFFFTLDYASTRSIRAFNQSAQNTVVLSSSSNVLQLNTWQYIELKVFLSNSAASGYVEGRVDGVTVMSGTLKTNNNATTLLWDRLHLGTSISATNISTCPALDDVYILNTAGAVNNDFLGDVRIDSYNPIASGTYNDWSGTGATVGTGNWSLVDEAPTIDTTDYVSTAVSGSIDTYTFRPLPDVLSRIYAVDIINYTGKIGSQLRQLAPVILYSGVTSIGTYKALPQNSFIFQDQVYDLNPITNSGWTPSGVLQSQFGFITT